MKKGRELFVKVDTSKQAEALMEILKLFKSGRSGVVSLEDVGGIKSAGNMRQSASLSGFAKKYKDVRIIDISASGLNHKLSGNLLELL